MSREYFTHSSESVTGGHPDKLCDLVAANVLDEAILKSLEIGKLPRVAMEVSAKGDLTSRGGTLLLFGEVSLPHGVTLDYETIARKTIERIGYNNAADGFSNKLNELLVRITEQSKDIDAGVSGTRTGAGDQGFMIGGAVDDGPEYMPMPIMIAHALVEKLTLARETTLPFLKPDGKSQVIVRYKNGLAVGVDHITIAASHYDSIDQRQLKQILIDQIIIPTLDSFNFGIGDDTEILINGAGAWTTPGPLSDAGTTNRKIIADTYGGMFPHGGGGLNGKDPTKVDLSGALAARYVAKALVANELAHKVQINVTYTIGQPDPKQVEINAFGTERVPLDVLESKAQKALDLSVDGIIEGLNLNQNIYADAAVGGFFGRKQFPWEQIPSL